MKCTTIEKTVDAYEVDWLLNLTKSDWKKLPDWFKEMHKANKVLIGGSEISVETKQFVITANHQDVLFRHENGCIEVLPKDEFYQTYKDIVCG